MLQLQTNAADKLQIDSLSGMTPRGFLTHYQVKGRTSFIMKYLEQRIQKNKWLTYKAKLKEQFKTVSEIVIPTTDTRNGIQITCIRL